MALKPQLIPLQYEWIRASWATKNPCFSKPTMRNKTKLMLHSTATPGAKAKAFINGQNKTSAGTSVEFWLDDEEVIQMFPVAPKKGCVHTWHCGSGSKGSYNGTHVACEMCEPIQARLIPINFYTQAEKCDYPNTYATTRIQMELKTLGYYTGTCDGKFGPLTTTAVKAYQKAQGLTQDGKVTRSLLTRMQKRKGCLCTYDVESATPFFNAAYDKAVRLFAFLCGYLGGKPSEILCHSEGAKLGYASNHGDVMHWFPYHGKSMDDFRADVQKCMAGNWVGLDEEKPEDTALNDAVDTLVKSGVINTPSIWKNVMAGVKTENVYALLRQCGAKVAEMSYRYSIDLINAMSKGVSGGIEPDYWLSADSYDTEHTDKLKGAFYNLFGENSPFLTEDYSTHHENQICMDDVRMLIRKAGVLLCEQSYLCAVDVLKGPAGINSPDYWKGGNYSPTNIRFLLLALATVFGDPDRRESK